MMKKIVSVAALAAAVLPAHAQSAGDLAFTAFNADEDGWAMVALVDLTANTTVYFSDNEWSGSAFNGGESYLSWNTGASVISAGTVVRFSSIDTTSLGATVGTLARQSVTGSTNYGLSQTEDTVYAYLGTSATAATTFLSAISSSTYGSAAGGSLDNTGLAVGSGAVQLAFGSDFAQYNGDRSSQTSFTAYKPLVSNSANFDDLGDGSFAATVPNTTAFTVTPVPEPETWALLLGGLGAVGLMARRRG